MRVLDLWGEKKTSLHLAQTFESVCFRATEDRTAAFIWQQTIFYG